MKHNSCLSLFAILALTGCMLQAEDVKEKDPVPAAGKISLILGCVVDSKPTKFKFTLSNDGTEDFKTTALAVNYNKLVFVKPNGEKVERVSWKRGAEEVAVKPGEKRSWDLELKPTMQLMELTEPGNYKIQWQVGEERSAEVTIIIEK